MLFVPVLFSTLLQARPVHSFISSRRRGFDTRRPRLANIHRFIDPWNDDRSVPIFIDGIDVSQQKLDVEHPAPDDKIPELKDETPWKSDAKFAIILLNMVALLWGTQHAIIKTVVADESTSAAAFTLCRFALAAIVALPGGITELFRSHEVSDGRTDRPDYATLARWGAEMGLWMFLGFAFQAVGLESTTAQKSGFLLYLNVKLVPFFAWVGYGRKIGASTWVSAAAAVLGTSLMGGLWAPLGGGDASSLTDAQRWNVGDIWSIAAAAASAMFILRLESASRTLPRNAGALNALSLLMVTLLSFTWTFMTADTSSSYAIDIQSLRHLFTGHLGEFFFLGAVTTAGANWIQTTAQRHVSAERASLIYAMDPVYGAVFSYFWLGETLPGGAGWVGAALIATAAASNAWLEWDNTQLPMEKEAT